MPIHDWQRVDAGVFHDFHIAWIASLSQALNQGILPADYYALAEQRRDTVSAEGPAQPLYGHGLMPGAENDHYAHKQRNIVVRCVRGDRAVAFVEVVSSADKSSAALLDLLLERARRALRRGVQFLLIDPYRPTARDPEGVHGALWSSLHHDNNQLPADKPFTLAAYAVGAETEAYVEPVAVGDVLPDMPLFLSRDRYVSVPLEKTYDAAYAGVPKRWRAVLEA